MPPPPTLDDLRRFAITRSFFPPTTLTAAIERLGFVQADPIRAPARAQDLTLRHRVVDYRAGDLERLYPSLDVEEDFFINYGFVSRWLYALMHPRAGFGSWPTATRRKVKEIIAFVQGRGSAHPRDVDAEFSHGTVTNYWGGSSNATTHLLDQLHYRGALKVARRDTGIRVYAVREPIAPVLTRTERANRVDALVDAVVGIYAPVPRATLSYVVSRLRYAVPQWQGELRAALKRARERLARTSIDGVDWFWPGAEAPSGDSEPVVRLVAPFDPVVWDRRRFELFWGWAYRFEAYTPIAKRKLGYYALPLLWRERAIGWANLSIKNGGLATQIGYVTGRPPRERAFKQALEDELTRMRRFLSADASQDTGDARSR